MATFTFDAAGTAGISMLNLGTLGPSLDSYDDASTSSTRIRLFDDADDFFAADGRDFRFGFVNGEPAVTGGTITGVEIQVGGVRTAVVTGLAADAPSFFRAEDADNDAFIINTLTRGNDRVTGSLRGDVLLGGLGQDVLTGRTGADAFVFRSAAESTVAARDTIADFSRAQGDRIGLGVIDADTTAAGNQAFEFVGRAAFSGDAGELRFAVTSGVTTVLGDRDGDGAADFAIRLNGAVGLTQADFFL